MVEEEQKWPTTAMALSWSTRRLATATACFGSQASSALTSLIFSPLIPPAALMSSAAGTRRASIVSPKEALAPVCGPATPITTSASVLRGKTTTDETARARMPFLNSFWTWGIAPEDDVGAVTTMLLLVFAQQAERRRLACFFPGGRAIRTLAPSLSVLSLLLEISH